MDFNHVLGFILYKTQRKLQNALHQQLKEFDITPEQWGMLRCLAENEGVAPTELAEIILKDKPNTTRIAEKLKNKGLVTYQASMTDKRSYLIFITEKGTELLEQVLPITMSLNQQAVKGIPQEKIEELKSLLSKVYHNI
ncbi:MAG: MarR family transcriptional regulator [Sporomusaceae bacterium]|nr:MarR family transcriptional regulator [Sporomusaceae bacterium]